MATEILSTSYINTLIEQYKAHENQKLITPLSNRISTYKAYSNAFSALTTKLTSFKTVLSNLKSTDSSIFTAKTATLSSTEFFSVAASSTASLSSYNLRVERLAKNDTLISSDYDSSIANAITGTHTFTIKTGDGEGGEFISKIEVTFSESETNKSVMEKLRNAINDDKAVVNSDAKSSSANYSGGTSTFKVDVGGVETSITVNGGGTYEELIDEVIIQLEKVAGITAEKVVDSDSGTVNLKITGNNSSKYISISHESGFDLVADLNIAVTKEKGASGIVSASTFSPVTGSSQFTLTAKESGLDFRILEVSDDSGFSALSSIGLNLGTSRPTFDQSQSPDTAGFLYADTTFENNQLNARIKFNSLDIQRNSNTISDLLDGVTFSLTAVMDEDDPDVNVKVTNDTKKIREQIDKFISSFNEIYTYIKNQSTDSVSRNLRSQAGISTLISSFQTISYTPIAGLAEEDINTLSEIGIRFDPISGLSVADSSLLTQKLEESVESIEALFNSENGVANTLYNFVEPYLGPAGYLISTKESYDKNIKNLDDKISSIKARIEKSSEVLRSRYEKLQLQLVQLYSAQSMLGFGLTIE